ncbi:MAG: EFR1 family ferrodoxin [Oscillospiraceae bacterium]
MILYFTGTGNSRYVAQRIAVALSDELLSMNDRIKAGNRSPVTSDERLVIVTPTYAWRIPRIVRDWLAETDFPFGAQAWFVMTCGSEIGNAAGYNRALCQEKQLTYMGTTQIIMPENYIAMFDAPQAEEARQIVAKAELDIDRVISAIAANQAFPPPRNNLYDRFMSGPVNPIFYSFFVKANAFAAGNACTGCGQCAGLCPMNNITIQNGKPIWGSDCTHCMACICRCPAQAIEYGKKSLGKPRYHFETL